MACEKAQCTYMGRGVTQDSFSATQFLLLKRNNSLENIVGKLATKEEIFCTGEQKQGNTHTDLFSRVVFDLSHHELPEKITASADWRQ